MDNWHNSSPKPPTLFEKFVILATVIFSALFFRRKRK